ncbi:MAG: terpene cyclase/mutase family protein [Planctomycetaceae bacterium]|nr:terpene cyclase/mutase family protein [Planctomycetaceae bacterium]
MDIEENSLESPPIISDVDFAPSGAPPVFGRERLVVPPILTEEQKNPSRKTGKKTARQLFYALVAWLALKEVVGTWTSFVFHFFLLILLALIANKPPQLPQGLLVGGFSKFEDGFGDGDGFEVNLGGNGEGEGEGAGDFGEWFVPDISPRDSLPEGFSTGLDTLPSGPPGQVSTDGILGSGGYGSPNGVPGGVPGGHLVGTMGGGGGFGSRTGGNRGKRGGPGDPTNSSEGGVEAGLHWLAKHQESDGGWRFDLGNCGRAGWCKNPGTHSNRNAATALAILPFLGAGYTHLDGQYKLVVRKGLNFLLDSRNGVETSFGNDFTRQTSQEKGMYAQGIVALALSEAYGMTRGKAKSRQEQEFEEKLRDTAQNAIRYIEAAQIPEGKFIGGWRYERRVAERPFPSDRPVDNLSEDSWVNILRYQAGDLSVSGWQMLALKSALLSGLEVKSTTLTRAELFLNSTQYDGGGQFNYVPLRLTNVDDKETRVGERIGEHPDSVYTCTAIGLLLRMYLGARPGFQPLDEGIDHLARWGGLKSDRQVRSAEGHCNLYYAYYGTLAMKHYGGSEWVRWYPDLREFLVQTQAKGEHENGSWFFPDDYCDIGGRLLNTSFAIMILEAPYRYMSLYDAQ